MVSTGHAIQALLVPRMAKQALQLPTPAGDVQALHSVVCDHIQVLLAVPAGQGLHDLELGASAKWPSGQRRQALLLLD